MRLHALLNWYDEPSSWLAATIASLKLGAVDSVIAIDGAYQLYPTDRPASPPDQAQVIHQTCQALGIASTIHTPTSKWAGGEVQKRTALFDLALAVSNEGDWWFVIDADTVVTQAPTDLKHILENTDLHAATATLHQLANLDTQAQHAQTFNWARTGQYPMRMLFRAQRIHCAVNHHTYMTEDERTLWASDSAQQEPALHIDGLDVEHRDTIRPAQRREDKDTYYRRRDQTGIERNTCDWKDCDQPGVHTMGRHFKRTTTSKGGWVADLVDICDQHIDNVNRENELQLMLLGVADPKAALERRQIIDGATA